MESEFTDGLITIRPYTPEDVGSLTAAAIESVSDVYPWLEWCHPGYCRQEAESWIAHCMEGWREGREFQFAIFESAGGRFLGGVGIDALRTKDKIVNLGYWVRSTSTRRGTATGAARLAARFALDELRFYRVEILASVRNIASQRVAERTGGTREGILRNRLLLHGVPHDAVIYSLIPGDLPLPKIP